MGDRNAVVVEMINPWESNEACKDDEKGSYKEAQEHLSVNRQCAASLLVGPQDFASWIKAMRRIWGEIDSGLSK